MALVVFLKGVNVGGHRRLRPRALAKELRHLEVVSLGAAGTFIVGKALPEAALRAEIQGRVPFEVEMMICSGAELLRLASADPFEGQAGERDIVPFVGVLASPGQFPATLPLSLPAQGDWCLKLLGCRGRFVLGLYRRQMKAITYLGQLERVAGAPMTVRNWNTILAIAKALRGRTKPGG